MLDCEFVDVDMTFNDAILHHAWVFIKWQQWESHDRNHADDDDDDDGSDGFPNFFARTL